MRSQDPPGKPGVIDTLAAGFSVVHRRIVLLLIPIALDMLLWAGPKVDMAPLMDRALAAYRHVLAQVGQGTPAASSELQQFSTQSEELLTPLKELNLMQLLAWQMPSIASGKPIYSGQASLESIGDPIMLFLFVAGVLLLGLLITSIYLGAIAHILLGAPFGMAFWKRLWLNWRRLTTYLCLLVAVALGATPVLLLVLAIVGALIPSLASFLAGAIAAVVLMVALYLFFVDEAIFLGNLNPLKAMRQSWLLVRKNFWSALALFLLVNLILLGMRIVWGFWMGSTIGFVAAVLGNAYIATGLAAASMIYYRDRSTALAVPQAKPAT